MKIPYLKIIVPVYIVLGYLYIIFSGVANEQSAVKSETRKFYNLILRDVHEMGGVYRQYGGQVIRGFILEISFLDKKSYDLIVLLKRIESFGFELGGGDKNNSYLFCKGNRGFWITKRPKLTIYYENKMSDCMK